MSRIIGIRHRDKKTAEGEARPTAIHIDSGGKNVVSYELEDDNAELDFVLGRYPTKWRKVTTSDDIALLPPHHVMWKKMNTDEGDKPENYPESHVRKVGKNFEVADKIPCEYDGLKIGDRFVMVLGGSGDRFAFALANRGHEVGAEVHRLPPFILKKERGERDKDDDARLLTEIFRKKPTHFYLVRKRDRDLIRVRETLRARMSAMKERIACESRLRQRFIGQVFLNEAGQFPEGSIEDDYDAYRASDQIFAVLNLEEGRAEKELGDACKNLDVYVELFEPITGVGPMIASRIISAVCDIRMFETRHDLKAFMGVHVLKGSRFARRRTGEVANWHPDTRQALFLLADQFNRRPTSPWGQVLLDYKKRLRAAHPEVIIGENNKRKYTDGHIHKMAMWRTATKFVEALWYNWWRLEGRPADAPLMPTPNGPYGDATERANEAAAEAARVKGRKKAENMPEALAA